jgi:hypothetical protein
MYLYWKICFCIEFNLSVDTMYCSLAYINEITRSLEGTFYLFFWGRGEGGGRMVLATPFVILHFFLEVDCAKMHASVERTEVGIWLFLTYQTCLDCISLGGEDGRGRLISNTVVLRYIVNGSERGLLSDQWDERVERERPVWWESRGCKLCIAKSVYDPGMKNLPRRVITGPYRLHCAGRAAVKRMTHRFGSRHWT